MRKAKLNPGVQFGHVKALTMGTAMHAQRLVDCKVFSIPRRTMSHIHEKVNLGVVQNRVVLCLIGNDVYNGTYNKTLLTRRKPKRTLNCSSPGCWPRTSYRRRWAPIRRPSPATPTMVEEWENTGSVYILGRRPTRRIFRFIQSAVAAFRIFLCRTCGDNWTYNDRRLQSGLSNVCGQYSVAYQV